MKIAMVYKTKTNNPPELFFFENEVNDESIHNLLEKSMKKAKLSRADFLIKIITSLDQKAVNKLLSAEDK